MCEAPYSISLVYQNQLPWITISTTLVFKVLTTAFPFYLGIEHRFIPFGFFFFTIRNSILMKIKRSTSVLPLQNTIDFCILNFYPSTITLLKFLISPRSFYRLPQLFYVERTVISMNNDYFSSLSIPYTFIPFLSLLH